MSYSVESKVTRLEAGHAAHHCIWLIATTCHLLPCLVRVPFLPRHLPLDQAVNLMDRLVLVDYIRVHASLKQGIHIKLTTAARAVAQEVEDALQPAHQLVEKAIVVLVHFMDKFVKVVLVPRAQINEGLYRLVGVRRHLLSLASFNRLDRIVYEHGEISDAVVHICRLVNADQRFVENGKKVSEKLQCGRLGHG